MPAPLRLFRSFPARPALRLLVTAASVVAVLAPAPAAHAQNLVQNPSFESFTNPNGPTQFTNWTTTPASSGGSIDQTRISHTGGSAARFGATRGQDDSLSQTFATTQGASYTFSFWLRNPAAGGDHFAAYWDYPNAVTPVFETGPTASTFDYTQFSYSVIASSSSTQIRFSGFDSPNSILLDDVSVTADPVTPPTAVTPEASSIVNLAGALLGPGVLGMVAVRKQKRRKGESAAA